MLKKHMVPLTPKGQLHRHQGKGSQMAPMPSRREISSLASAPNASINDYAKATPMPLGQPTPPSSGDDEGY